MIRTRPGARCRACSTSGKDWVLTRPRDLPCGGEFAQVQWRKRRWRCRTEDCPQQTFTEQVAQVPAGMRTTTRLRAALAVPVAVAVEDGTLTSSPVLSCVACAVGPLLGVVTVE